MHEFSICLMCNERFGVFFLYIFLSFFFCIGSYQLHMHTCMEHEMVVVPATHQNYFVCTLI